MHELDPVIDRLRRRLSGTLPGASAQLRMAPTTRMNRVLADVRGKPCREAGVLVLLYAENDSLNLLLTLRPGHMTVHPGQISFPGGRRETGETLLETALREAEEEVGLSRQDVEPLGELTPLYIPPSNFCAHPFVAYCPALPSLCPIDAEVHALLHVSLSDLLSPDAIERERWTVRGEEMDVPYFRFGSYKIWGATAMMLSELLAVMRPIVA